tara:strand:- start:166 stop:795 length:630 start_codon:yes stop_codon:yes gene_type:complete
MTHHSNSVSSTSSQLDFLAKISVSQDDRQDSKTVQDQPCSMKSSVLLGKFDLDSSYLKTLDIYSVTKTGKRSKKSSFKLPKQGIMRNGELYQLQTWEPVTNESVYGLLPTPTTQDTIAHPNAKLTPNGRRLCSNGKSHSLNLQDRLTLPTPTARDYKDSGDNMNYEKAAKKYRLAGVLNHTHSTQTGEGMNLNPHFVEEMQGYPIGWLV